jgi:mediator of RNA polymerase II transcription subunit 31
MTAINPLPSSPPPPISPRFTLELEFVLCLSNPFYLQYLAATYPHLLNPSTNTANKHSIDENSDSACFARYLAYLYAYWRTPTYSQYLTHPGAVLRNLELLQQEQFRKDIIRPDVIARLFETGTKMEEESVGAPGVQAAAGEAAAEMVRDEYDEGE